MRAVRALSVSAALWFAGTLLVLHLTPSVLGQAPQVQSSAEEVSISKTRVRIEILRDQFVAATEAAGKCSIRPPKVMIEDVPSFGAYDPETNTLRTSAWSQLRGDETAMFLTLVGPNATEAQARQEFELEVHQWVIVHELGHWWQTCRGLNLDKDHYRIEYGANRIAAAYWTERDPSIIAHLEAKDEAVLKHLPNPVPQGQPVESFFNANYEKLLPTPAYIWFQVKMCLSAFQENPKPSFVQALRQTAP